jgi:ribonuclease-3
MNSKLEDLEQALGYSFQDRALLRRALTHSSSANEAGEAASADNERLEFLGDAVLGWIVSEWLFDRFRGFAEGQLSLVKNYVVSAAHLLPAAQRLDLGEYLRLGRGEETAGGRSKQRLLVNAFEAVLAAVYLDGGAERARDLVFRFVIPGDAEAEQLAGAGPPHDYRAELERLARERDLPKPTYTPWRRGWERISRLPLRDRRKRRRRTPRRKCCASGCEPPDYFAQARPSGCLPALMRPTISSDFRSMTAT